MDNMTTCGNKVNEYSFRWGKQFSFLTLKTLDTKLVITGTSIKIDMDKFYFGFIKGKSRSYDIPLSSVKHVEIKTLFSLSDLVIAGIYIVGGIFNPLFFLIVPISIWACLNTNIILSTKTDTTIKIPSFSKKDANEFLYYINDLYIEA